MIVLWLLYYINKSGTKKCSTWIVALQYTAQVKQKHGILERVNYNLGDRKAKAIEDALRYFKMI